MSTIIIITGSSSKKSGSCSMDCSEEFGIVVACVFGACLLMCFCLCFCKWCTERIERKRQDEETRARVNRAVEEAHNRVNAIELQQIEGYVRPETVTAV